MIRMKGSGVNVSGLYTFSKVDRSGERDQKLHVRFNVESVNSHLVRQPTYGNVWKTYLLTYAFGRQGQNIVRTPSAKDL